MQDAAAMPPANKGSVGCAPMLGSMKPMAPAAKIAANVASHLRMGMGWEFIAAAYDELPSLVLD
jgi:hypothetical protein